MSGFTLGAVHSMGFDDYVMTCVHHQSIAQSVFAALKILCFIYSLLPLPNSWQRLIFLLSPQLFFFKTNFFKE